MFHIQHKSFALFEPLFEKKERGLQPLSFFGSGGGTRTPDRVVNSHLLYQLSYT